MIPNTKKSKLKKESLLSEGKSSTPSQLLFSLSELENEMRNHVEVELDVECPLEFFEWRK